MNLKSPCRIEPIRQKDLCVLIVGISLFLLIPEGYAEQKPKAAAADSQSQTITDKERRILLMSGEERWNYFSTPNGLQRAAKKYGEFVVTSDLSEFGAYPGLAYAAKVTPLIVRGKILRADAKLFADGCDIETTYVIHPDELLKGSLKGDISFYALGGRYLFPDGTIAEMRSKASGFLKVGKSYLLLLDQDSDTGEYTLGHATEAVFQLTDSGDVDPLLAHDTREHSMTKEVSGQRTEPFLAKMRTLAAQP